MTASCRASSTATTAASETVAVAPAAATAAITVTANTASTRLSALKTSRPMRSPMGMDTPGARNFRGAELRGRRGPEAGSQRPEKIHSGLTVDFHSGAKIYVRPKQGSSAARPDPATGMALWHRHWQRKRRHLVRPPFQPCHLASCG